jgi:hypothetical protein
MYTKITTLLVFVADITQNPTGYATLVYGTGTYEILSVLLFFIISCRQNVSVHIHRWSYRIVSKLGMPASPPLHPWCTWLYWNLQE